MNGRIVILIDGGWPRLMTRPLRWYARNVIPENCVRLNLANPFGNAPVLYVAETDSTMEDAAAAAAEGAAHGTVFRAGFQRKGRGRGSGRVWEASKGENLLFTMIFRSSAFLFPPFRLPLLMGLSVALLLEERFSLEPKIKWPNDVLVGGKKICGVLCEGRGNSYLAGIGLNCNQTEFSAGIRDRVVSLSSLLGGPVEVESALEEFLAVCSRVLAAEISGTDLWREAVETRLYRKGEEIAFLSGLPEDPGCFEGTLVGIGTDGELLIRRDGIPTSWYAGEISFADC